MPHFDRHFTLREANRLIPRIQEVFQQISQLIDTARGHAPNAQKITMGRTNGSQNKKKQQHQHVLDQINKLISEITDQGIVIQDVNRGLVDFPAYIQGEEVFLCYEISDGDSIQYYHDLNAGYAGRQPIPEDME